MTEPLGGWTDPREEWAFFVARLHADGPKGPACADVVRRFVAGEIEVTCREVGVATGGR